MTLVILVFTVGIIQSTRPKSVFKASFNQTPPTGISAIKSHYWSFADGGFTYLRLKTTSEAFEKIVPPRFKKTTMANFQDELNRALTSKSRPDWWQPVLASAGVYYMTKTDGANKCRVFVSETELLLFDPEAGIAYYYFNGID